MGDIKASSGDEKSRFVNWFQIGRNQGSSSCKPPPTSIDNEENDESEDDEARDYFSEGRQKPKYTVPDGRTQNGLSHGKDRAADTSQGGNRLDIGQKTCREVMGAFFHPQCFCCSTCGRQIAEHELMLSVSGQPHHKSCYDGLRHPTCNVCHRPLPLNRFWRTANRSHPFWFQKYCRQHDFDNTPRCYVCERLQPWDATYVSLGGHRKLCSECKESSVTFTSECQPLYQAVREFLEGMRIKLHRPVSVRIVDEEALDLAWMADGISLALPALGYMNKRGYEIIVLLLYGFPRLDSGAWLAQELMREWLLAKGYNRLPPELEDSICSLVAYLWLESEVTSAVSSSKKGREWEVEKKLGQFFMYRIANTFPAACCGAFRATKIAVDKYGLCPTIEYINRTGCLPW